MPLAMSNAFNMTGTAPVDAASTTGPTPLSSETSFIKSESKLPFVLEDYGDNDDELLEEVCHSYSYNF